MIVVNSPMQQDAIIELLNQYDKDGVSFSYKNKQGIKLFFETNAEDLEAAAKLAKEEIKAQEWGKVLYFQVIPA
ncbi:hypothetical protein [Vagococcus acidifermentans]|uniref:Uncharacterized protein n=1 Tax=Vagococcus acidifermentans TaxID=564710 RepID=A0A430AQ36_9ENTE|nr:hypothetical protein [Vagococcus acidifermentans]RSU10229.1 hypothetical protein CBF27_10810 [Vagococcus acidifermentans]